MTPEARKALAEAIIRENAKEIEYLDLWEMLESENPTEEEVDEMWDLIHNAKVTVTFSE